MCGQRSTPVSAAASKVPFQVAALVLAACLLYLALGDMTGASKYGSNLPMTQVRIKPLELRNGSVPGPPDFGIADFGLVMTGCKVPKATAAWRNGTFEVRVHCVERLIYEKLGHLR